jgi:Domain of unknown function (DUF222)/HNH endonuclease
MFVLTGAEDVEALLPALASVPVASDDCERLARIRALEQLVGAVAAAQARETAEFAASRRAAAGSVSGRGTALRPGADARVERDIAGQIALARRISPFRARRFVGLAGVLVRELPATFAALQAGRTSAWRAELVARHTLWLSREHRREVDELLAPQLEVLGDRRVETETRRHAYRLDPRGYVQRLSAAENERTVTIRPAPDTMVRLSALLPVASGVAAYAALSKAADTRRAAGDGRSRGQLMADTLIERLLGQPAAPGPVEIPVEIELVMTDRALLGASPREGGQEPAWLVGYGPLPAGHARRLALGGENVDNDRPTGASPTSTDRPGGAPRWIRRLFRSPTTGELAAMDSRRRTFTDAQRRFIRIRDQYCRTTWCEAPIRHIDHVLAHADGGSTSIDNGQGLCEACNQTKEIPGWRRYRYATGRIDIITPLGRRHPGTGPPAAPGTDPATDPDPPLTDVEHLAVAVIDRWPHAA